MAPLLLIPIFFGHSHQKDKNLKSCHHLLLLAKFHCHFLFFLISAFSFGTIFFFSLFCTSPLQPLNIAGCCCVPHFFDLMCCFKLLVATFNSSLWAFKVVSCCCAFHLLEFFLKLLIANVRFTSLFLLLGFLISISKKL